MCFHYYSLGISLKVESTINNSARVLERLHLLSRHTIYCWAVIAKVVACITDNQYFGFAHIQN